MTDLFLLKLIAELLEGDKPTQDEIGCVKKILKEMIGEDKSQISYDMTPSNLDPEAEHARQDLLK